MKMTTGAPHPQQDGHEWRLVRVIDEVVAEILLLPDLEGGDSMRLFDRTMLPK